MGPIDINGWEFIVLALLAVFVLGPERLPEYAAKLGRLVRQARLLADNARVQLRQQMGPEFENVDWAAYDPRQYDPRRIVRQALAEPGPEGRVDADVPPEGADASTSTAPSASESASASEQSARAADGWPADGTTKPVSAAMRVAGQDPARSTPWDADAT